MEIIKPYPNITIIVAISKNMCIGKEGKIPWEIKEDIFHFKKTTIGDFAISGRKNIVVMGRKTFESIAPRFRPLPDRINIILSRNQSFEIPLDDCRVVHSIEDVLTMAEQKKVFIIGGEEIYKLFLPYANCLIVSHIDVQIENGDAFFPKIDGKKWPLVSSNYYPSNPLSFSINIYERRFQ